MIKSNVIQIFVLMAMAKMSAWERDHEREQQLAMAERGHLSAAQSPNNIYILYFVLFSLAHSSPTFLAALCVKKDIYYIWCLFLCEAMILNIQEWYDEEEDARRSERKRDA